MSGLAGRVAELLTTHFTAERFQMVVGRDNVGSEELLSGVDFTTQVAGTC